MHRTKFARVLPAESALQDQHHPKIRMVSATRGSLEEFEHTMLGKTLTYHSQLFDFELFVQDHNTAPLADLYNTVIELSANDPAILLFVHDDVMITDFFWPQRLDQALDQFSIVGIVGTTHRIPRQCSWCFTEHSGVWHQQRYFSGSVAIGWPPWIIHAYGPAPKQCQLLDAYFLAARSETLITSGVRFDPRFDFHFYDLDFCRQAEVQGLSMGTVDISVVHASAGHHDDNWHNKYVQYIDKWGE